MCYHGVRHVFRAAGVRIWLGVFRARGVKAMQTRLRNHERPFGMAASRLTHDAHDGLLEWIVDLQDG